MNSLTQAAESLRNAAAMAESFATVLHSSAISPTGSNSGLSHLNMFPNFANAGLPQQLQQQLQQQGHSAAASQITQQLLQQLAQQNEVAQFQNQQSARKDEPAPRKRKRGAAADGEGKSERKKRVKDPDAPKRPPSAYLLFQNQVRKEMVKQHDGLPYHEVLGEIAKKWAEMPDDQKKVRSRSNVFFRLFPSSCMCYSVCLWNTNSASLSLSCMSQTHPE